MIKNVAHRRCLLFLLNSQEVYVFNSDNLRLDGKCATSQVPVQVLVKKLPLHSRQLRICGGQ